MVLLGPGEPADRLGQCVIDLDRTIRQIRTRILELRGPINAVTSGLRHRILQIAADLTSALAFAPQMSFSGLVDTALSAELADDVCALIGEALTNVARHARATSAYVEVDVSAGKVVVVVSDNGVGISTSTLRSGVLSGLANMLARAEHRGGRFTTTGSTISGTTLTWKAPLS